MNLAEILARLEICARELHAIIDAQSNCLDAPYRSQWDPDGDQNKSDCGPACAAMLLEYYGRRIGINVLAREAGMSASKRYTLPADLVRASNLHDLEIKRRTDCDIEMLQDEIVALRPVIVLIHYGSLGTLRQDQTWSGGHWVVVVGVTDDIVYIHDPDWRGKQRNHGRNLAIPRTIFEDAWEKCNLDGNTPHQGLWIVGEPYQHKTGGTTITPSLAST